MSTVGIGIEYDTRGTSHDLLHKRDVGLDPLDRRLDQNRIVNRRQQFYIAR